MADNVNNRYDSAVMAIKSAVEKSRYRAAKVGKFKEIIVVGLLLRVV